MTDKELRTLDEMLTNLEIWSTWNKTFANEMIGICSKMRNLLADRKTEPIPHDDYIESENDHLEARCLNCNNAKACKEKHWEGCIYEPKDEKTCETCRYWKYIAHEWQCETTKCQGYTPKTENSSEMPNNCEHITEDGVTCAKYPACDDCLDNPLNKVKGSKRLLKGYHEKEDEPQKDCNGCKFVGTYDTEFPCANCSRKTKDYYTKDEQTDCPWK